MSSFGSSQAGWVGFADFGLKALGTIIGGRNQRRDTNRRNALLRQKHAADIHAYNLKLNNDVIAWKNLILDNEKENETNYQAAVGAIAQGQIDTWNNLVNTNNQIQVSFAKMLSTGGGEQSGRRSSATIDPRKALLEHGATVAKLGAELSGSSAKTALAGRLKLDQVGKTIFNNNIKAAMGRPIPGTPPQLHDAEFHQHDGWETTALGLGNAALSGWRTFQDLKPPTVQGNSGMTSDVDTNTYDYYGDTTSSISTKDAFTFDGSWGDFGTNTYGLT
tara:strand:+ start:46 stop:873 length:828 start_codon:yes stop_codon:yes gene_type:complete